jgi:threonine dehydrogenase-like Zn-dependent dehydrogenase
MMGAGRVIAIDEVPERLAMAEAGGAETIDFSEVDVYDELMSRTAKRGPDSCTDAVGCEADAQARAKAMRPRTTCRRPSRRSTSQVWRSPVVDDPQPYRVFWSAPIVILRPGSQSKPKRTAFSVASSTACTTRWNDRSAAVAR